MTDPILNTATALRLARRPDIPREYLTYQGGVTVSQLAAECGITRPSAHAILTRLLAAGELTRTGSGGRVGHIYRTK